MTSAAEEARERDAVDPLRAWREQFAVPTDPTGQPVAYLCGHSLGLQPHGARAAVERVLDNWAALGVDGHFSGPEPWYRFDEPPAALLEPVVGARAGEVAVAATLTVDLHLLLASFYRPRPGRDRVLVEATAFPSDRYAIDAQVAWRGLDPATAVVEVDDRGEGSTTERVLACLEARGDEIALVLLGGVNYLTGERLDIERITRVARTAGCVVGWDLAHAAGNVPLRLHDWGVDFAAWCTYKYLNGGPGAVGAYFVHERHGDDETLVRLAGWWGNDPDRRFAMDQERAFTPRPGAAGWKVSNPPVLALAPLRAALAPFATIGMETLRAKSVALTAAFAAWLDDVPGVQILTPRDPDRRGAMLTLHLPGRAAAVHAALGRAGVVGDLRAPDTVRLTPVPLYTGWHDAWRAVAALRDALRAAP